MRISSGSFTTIAVFEKLIEKNSVLLVHGQNEDVFCPLFRKFVSFVAFSDFCTFNKLKRKADYSHQFLFKMKKAFILLAFLLVVAMTNAQTMLLDEAVGFTATNCQGNLIKSHPTMFPSKVN